MTVDAFSLLSAPLIRTRAGGTVQRLSLPALLAALMRDEVEALPALRPHQRHALHMFLAQVAALAMHRAGIAEPPDAADSWRDLLLGLTPEHGEIAWSLVVEDVRRPAFLQPPAPEGRLDVFRNTIPSPDALDVLITAKNFDIKSAIAAEAEPDDWFFALISLQTMEGFLGAGNYGISKMNGGFSSRSFLGLAPEGGMGAHLRRDINAMFASRNSLLEFYADYPTENGIALTWLEPWDGLKSLSVDQLDIWFIEICRRVRLCARSNGTLEARSTGTSVARIDAKHRNGILGDFWAPINEAENKVFSLDARGFSTRVLTRLLLNADFRLPPAMKPLPLERAMYLVARGVTRGQGKTEGLHERILPFGTKFIAGLSTPEGREHLGRLSEQQTKETEIISRALRFGCAIVAANGGEPDRDDYKAADPYLQRLEYEIEAGFFSALEDRLAQGDQAKVTYLRHLIRSAEKLLLEAANIIPCASLHRHRARSHASRAFWGTLWGPKSELVNDMALILEHADAN